MTVTASDLSTLLAARHSGDVFVPECKMGAAGSRVLDAWVLLPTWSPMTTIGYEIKVSRSDWLQDQKFEEYRAACHLFFVVAPKGVVQAAELPTGMGLLEPIGHGNGRRLVMRAKAVRQKPDAAKLVQLMAHVLMWRKDQRDFGAQTREQRAAFWRAWVDERQAFARIGRDVRGRMRLMLRDALDAQAEAQAQAERLSEAKAALDELGVTPGYDFWSTRKRIGAALKQDGHEMIADLDATIERLANFKNLINGALSHSTEDVA